MIGSHKGYFACAAAGLITAAMWQVGCVVNTSDGAGGGGGETSESGGSDAGGSDFGGAGVGGGAGGGPEVAYRYVAIRSRANGTVSVTLNENPGPDLDAVELIDGVSSEFAVESHDGQQGSAGTGNTNVNDDPETVLGASDAFLGDGSCDLAEGDLGDGAKFWSMGAGAETIDVQSGLDEGYIVVSFATDIPDGTTIRVHELSPADCNNVTEYADQYEVFIGKTTAVIPTAPDVTILDGSDFESLGLSNANGGTQEFDVVYP